jgi:hypothetical protein
MRVVSIFLWYIVRDYARTRDPQRRQRANNLPRSGAAAQPPVPSSLNRGGGSVCSALERTLTHSLLARQTLPRKTLVVISCCSVLNSFCDQQLRFLPASDDQACKTVMDYHHEIASLVLYLVHCGYINMLLCLLHGGEAE